MEEGEKLASTDLRSGALCSSVVTECNLLPEGCRIGMCDFMDYTGSIIL